MVSIDCLRQVTSECPALGCCEYDFCGEGTSWDLDVEYCVADPESPGFNSSFPPDFDPTCVPRVCCEETCCGDGTTYSRVMESCIPIQGSGNCIDSGGTITTENCCESLDDFPNTCLIGACGYSLEFSEPTLVCSCPEGFCYDGNACVSIMQAMCVSAGGTVTTGTCCKSVDDFPNTCLIGACGCGPDDSREIKVCTCPNDHCWDGNDCVSDALPTTASILPEMTPTTFEMTTPSDEAAAGCIDSGGTVSTANCCIDTENFPSTCVIGPCGCSPEFSKETPVCECPDELCFDGNTCVSFEEAMRVKQCWWKCHYRHVLQECGRLSKHVLLRLAVVVQMTATKSKYVSVLMTSVGMETVVRVSHKCGNNHGCTATVLEDLC